MVAAIGLAIGCGSDAPSRASMLCKAELAVLCHQMFTCPGQMGTQYTSEADCNAKRMPSCDGPITCISGTYHVDKDQQCFDAMNAVTCDQLAANPGAALPPVCLEVCTTI
jgi:hypothetical protein